MVMSECIGELSTKSQNVNLHDGCLLPAERRYGGVIIYAPNEDVLALALDAISASIHKCSQLHVMMDQNYLLYLCREHLGFNLDKRIFRACVGAECRLGNIEQVRCAAISGKAFRVIVHSINAPELRQNLVTVIKLSEKEAKLPIRMVQDLFFPDRAKGTWFVAAQIMQRLAYLGVLEQVDKWNFKLLDSLKNAKSKTSGKLISNDRSWLV